MSWLGRPGVHLQTTTNLAQWSWQDLLATDGATWSNGTMSTNGFVSVTNYPTSGSSAVLPANQAVARCLSQVTAYLKSAAAHPARASSPCVLWFALLGIALSVRACRIGGRFHFRRGFIAPRLF